MGKEDKNLQPRGRDRRKEDSSVHGVKSQRLWEGCMKGESKGLLMMSSETCGKVCKEVSAVKPGN